MSHNDTEQEADEGTAADQTAFSRRSLLKLGAVFAGTAAVGASGGGYLSEQVEDAASTPTFGYGGSPVTAAATPTATVTAAARTATETATQEADETAAETQTPAGTATPTETATPAGTATPTEMATPPRTGVSGGDTAPAAGGGAGEVDSPASTPAETTTVADDDSDYGTQGYGEYGYGGVPS